jgi:hypothetical protein
MDPARSDQNLFGGMPVQTVLSDFCACGTGRGMNVKRDCGRVLFKRASLSQAGYLLVLSTAILSLSMMG